MHIDQVRERLIGLKASISVRDRAGINTVVADLLNGGAVIGSQWEAVATLMLHNGELSMACLAADRLVRERSDAFAARFKQASIYARAGRAAEAAAIMSTLPPSIPDMCGNAYIQGTIALNLGDTSQAQAHLARAVTANPASGQSWLVLAMTQHMSSVPDLANSILAAEHSLKTAPDHERAAYAYALGKTYDDLGEYDLAAASFRKGADLVRPTRPYDAKRDAAEAMNALKGFTSKSIKAINDAATADTSRPIIVTGTPRSGTTLVEQILTTHSDVCGGEELGRFGLVIGDLGGNSAAHLGDYIAKKGSSETLSSLYLHLMSERFGAAGRVVDKSLDASRYLGVLASIMPEAPLIWMRRNAADRAWSCFRTYFLSGISWSWSFEDIATHFQLEDQLLAAWQSILGDRLLVLDYEALVKQPELHIPAITDHCGLSFEPALMEPHKTKRIVATASVTQVRQPINQDAIGKAKGYEELMAPFYKAYGYK